MASGFNTTSASQVPCDFIADGDAERNQLERVSLYFLGFFGILLVVASVQLARLVRARVAAKKSYLWVSMVLIWMQVAFRFLGTLLLSNLVEGFQRNSLHEWVAFILLGIPFQFSFLTFSFVAAQWVSIVHNRSLSVTPFRNIRGPYLVGSSLVVTTMWILTGFGASSENGNDEARTAGFEFGGLVLMGLAFSLLLYGIALSFKIGNNTRKGWARKRKKLIFAAASRLRSATNSFGTSLKTQNWLMIWTTVMGIAFITQGAVMMAYPFVDGSHCNNPSESRKALDAIFFSAEVLLITSAIIAFWKGVNTACKSGNYTSVRTSHRNTREVVRSNRYGSSKGVYMSRKMYSSGGNNLSVVVREADSNSPSHGKITISTVGSGDTNYPSARSSHPLSSGTLAVISESKKDEISSKSLPIIEA